MKSNAGMRKDQNMKKTMIAKVCNIISILLLICFFWKTIHDYSIYTSTLNSAPFYVWILVNGIYFLVPAAIAFAAGVVLTRKK